ncbi:MAG TPA: glycolate oxidase subunit GlcE [Usitatibacter sp.]|jgi:glycolate oxidase FAD binding subunit|nr:glycolate oxidase subunit GlcE [Usitatibacter sp.]
MTDAFIPTLCERVREAGARKAPLRIRGGGTKDFYGEASAGDPLEMSGYAGIVAYEPKELVLTVRAGTPLTEVDSVLASERQMLPFEPPHFGRAATIGGVVAAGLSGPRRPYAGAVRDFVLGARIVNGKGEDLSFGGRVIKNVAGYDVSRLMAGSLGTLGILTELSFKVLPRPVEETTLVFEMDEGEAIRQANVWAGQPLPVSATSWQDGVLRVRLSGAPPAVAAARTRMGGQESSDAAHWTALREQELPYFRDPVLWRVSLPQASEPLELGARPLVEWGGGVRWIAGEQDALALRSTVERAGGHAILFRAADKSAGAFHPLKPAILKIHKRLKAAFDPEGILNPGRMYDF